MTKVKICGITRVEDALMAEGLGADAIGVVNIPESRRAVNLAGAKEIFNALPPFVAKVLVASPGNLDDLRKMEKCGMDAIQFHGDESPAFIREIREHTDRRLIKQVAVEGMESVDTALAYADYVDALLLDTKSKGVMGGTGLTHDWGVSEMIARKINKPVILAGGLTPLNVRDAILKVKPYAADVASGTESAYGVKDMIKVKEFIRNAKDALKPEETR